MGIENRDWYREAYAEKTGQVYDRKTGTYRPADPRYFPRQFRRPVEGGEVYEPPVVRPPNPRAWHPVLTFVVTALFCLAIYGLVKLVTRRH